MKDAAVSKCETKLKAKLLPTPQTTSKTTATQASQIAKIPPLSPSPAINHKLKTKNFQTSNLNPIKSLRVAMMALWDIRQNSKHTKQWKEHKDYLDALRIVVDRVYRQLLSIDILVTQMKQKCERSDVKVSRKCIVQKIHAGLCGLRGEYNDECIYRLHRFMYGTINKGFKAHWNSVSGLRQMTTFIKDLGKSPRRVLIEIILRYQRHDPHGLNEVLRMVDLGGGKRWSTVGTLRELSRLCRMVEIKLVFLRLVAASCGMAKLIQEFGSVQAKRLVVLDS